MANPHLLRDEERQVICAGTLPDPQRTDVWMAHWPAVRRLGTLGYVRWIEPVGADGRASVSVPACLTDAGIRIARELGCFDHP